MVRPAGDDDESEVAAGGGVPVARAGRPFRAGPAGFRCTRWRVAGRAEVSEPTPDPGRAQPLGRDRALPWTAQVRGERPGQAQPGVRGQDQPCPSVGRGRAAQLRHGPPESLLDHAETPASSDPHPQAWRRSWTTTADRPSVRPCRVDGRRRGAAGPVTSINSRTTRVTTGAAAADSAHARICLTCR